MTDIVLKSTTQKAKPITYSYLRVSTTEQKEGNSIDVQKDFAEKYANKHALGTVTYFQETKSASKVQDGNFDIASDLYKSLANRPKLQELVKHAQQKKFTDLIVYSRDRLARNLEMFIALNFFFSKNGIKIHYTKPGEMLNSDNDRLSKFFSIILGSVAELEANLIASRVKSGQEQCIKSGAWAGGRLPYGYCFKKLGKKNQTLEPISNERRHIKTIFQLYTNYGLSYRKIVQYLNQEYKDGNGPWTKGKIESIIKNEVYRGYLVWDRRSKEKTRDTEWESIKSKPREELEFINEKQWENAIKLRQKKSLTKDPKYYNTPFLLRGKLICGYCNKPMKPKNYGKDAQGNARDCIYRCDVAKREKPHFRIKKDTIESLFLAKFTSITSPQNINDYWNIYNDKVKEEETSRYKYLTNIEVEIPKIQKNIFRVDNILKDVESNLMSLEIEMLELEEKLDKANKKEKHTLNPEVKVLDKQIRQESVLRDALLAEKANLSTEKKQLERIQAQLVKSDTNYFKNSDELKMAVEQFIKKDFFELNNIRKRMIVDILVDSIILTKGENDPQVDIVLNKP